MTAPITARWLVSGVLATLAMDLGAAFARRVRLTAGLPPPALGRWFVELARGRFSHDTILDVAPVRGELPLALVTHYSIGIALTCAFLSLAAAHANAAAGYGFWLAISFGLLTNLLPWLLMFPSMGFGVMGLRAPPELLLVRSSFANHVFFGLGLWFSLRYISALG